MYLMFPVRNVHFFGMLKVLHIFFISQKKIPQGLPNLGAQIRCAQNWYLHPEYLPPK